MNDNILYHALATRPRSRLNNRRLAGQQAGRQSFGRRQVSTSEFASGLFMMAIRLSPY